MKEGILSLFLLLVLYYVQYHTVYRIKILEELSDLG